MIETKDGRILTVRQWREFAARIKGGYKELKVTGWGGGGGGRVEGALKEVKVIGWGGEDADRLFLSIPDELPVETPKCETMGCTNDAEVVVKFDSGVRANICSACLTLVKPAEEI